MDASAEVPATNGTVVSLTVDAFADDSLCEFVSICNIALQANRLTVNCEVRKALPNERVFLLAPILRERSVPRPNLHQCRHFRVQQRQTQNSPHVHTCEKVDMVLGRCRARTTRAVRAPPEHLRAHIQL